VRWLSGMLLVFRTALLRLLGVRLIPSLLLLLARVRLIPHRVLVLIVSGLLLRLVASHRCPS